ncbi:MAG: esterase-like activity of phytase family protein [Alphaproteobacteria bacterium]|nr:esterase-like activity of phytase family protein [Alphaproteobacteria bacterium]
MPGVSRRLCAMSLSGAAFLCCQAEAWGDETSYRDLSCPMGQAFLEPRPIELQVEKIPLMRGDPSRDQLGSLRFLGGFSLTSPDPRFGGLSGLETLEDGQLLAVTDEGNFIWIDLDDDSLAPKAAHLAPLRDERGEALVAKSEADAEGLARAGSLVFVSFERRHRVLAFDIERCGAAARGVSVLGSDAEDRLREAFVRDGIPIEPNSGIEALAVTDQGDLLLGLETKREGRSPLSARPLSLPPVFDLDLAPGAPELVGLDTLADAGEPGRARLFSLHRGLSRILGDMIVLEETSLEPLRESGGRQGAAGFRLGDRRRLAGMDLRTSIDNFEGLAVERRSDGSVRIYIVSDNNFSPSQRTLLMVFELREDPSP